MSRESAPPDAVQAFLAEFPPQVQQIALRLRRLLVERIPSVTEHVYPGWRIVSYRLGEGHANQVCWIAPLRDGVNLGLCRGAALPDPAGLLHGKAKQARNIRLRSPEDCAHPAVAELVDAAVAEHLRHPPF